MTMDIQTQASPDLRLEAQQVIAAMRQMVSSERRPWLTAVLEAIGRWPLAREQVGERTYRYLIGGEAFDWLLLAERLCDKLDGLAPEDEVEELLLLGRLPVELSQEEFRSLLGAAKYRAHLNFFYGVRVEEALQMAVEEEVHKERLSRIWENGHADDEACRRIYGATRSELLRLFCGQRALPPGDRLSLGELTEFTYWLFRHRLNYADPAKVASDTRKGMSQLTRLEARRALPGLPPPRGASALGLR